MTETTETTGYCAQDLARHELTHPCPLSIYFEDRRATTAAELVVDSCAVGYGGHYGEVLENAAEGEVMGLLADHLAPLYGMAPDEALELLCEVRDEWSRRMVSALLDAKMFWKLQDFHVPAKEAST